MNKITDALTLKDTAPRSHVAMVYGIGGLIIGTLFLSGDKNEEN